MVTGWDDMLEWMPVIYMLTIRESKTGRLRSLKICFPLVPLLRPETKNILSWYMLIS